MATVKEYKIRISEEGAKKVRSEMQAIDKVSNNLSNTLKRVGSAMIAAFSVSAGFNILRSIKDTTAQFEALQTRLDALYGSVVKGKNAFDVFNRVAATTPYELQDVVEAGAQLKAFGINAEENIKILADLAAFMGTSIVDAASAMGRAFAGGAGAADIFRERGILNLIKMKSGIEDFSKVTIEEFREAMFKTFTDPNSGIIGATDKLSKTIVGMESNAKDALSRLADTIGQSFAPEYKSALKSMIGVTNMLIITFTDWESKIGGQVTNIVRSFQDVKKVMDFQIIIDQMWELNKQLLRSGNYKQIQFLASQFSFLTKEQKFAIQAADNYWDTSKALVKVIYELEDGLKNANKALLDFDISTDALDINLGDVIKNYKTINHYGQELITATIEQNEALRELNLSFENFNFAINDYIERIPQIIDDPTWDRIRSKVDQVASMFGNEFVRSLESGENMMKSFLKSFKNMLAEMVAEMLAKAAIFSIFNMFVPGLGTALTGMTSAFGGFRQHGGPVFPGMHYNINERKQNEVFIPNIPGRVEPAKNIVINIKASDVKSMEQWLRENDGGKMLTRIISEA